jgi:hypothetical protein
VPHGQIRVFLADQNLTFFWLFSTRRVRDQQEALEKSRIILTSLRHDPLPKKKTEDFDRIDIMESRSASICFRTVTAYADKAEGSVDDLIARLDEPFSRTLLRRLTRKRMTDPEVYKRAI